jgi:hypothetical protein
MDPLAGFREELIARWDPGFCDVLTVRALARWSPLASVLPPVKVVMELAVAFAFYIWFGAPVVLAWTSFMFLKSALANGSSAAKGGLWGSIALLAMWINLLLVQFGSGKFNP